MKTDFNTLTIVAFIINFIILIIGIILNDKDKKESNIGWVSCMCVAILSLGVLVVSYDMFGCPFLSPHGGYESYLTLFCGLNPIYSIIVLIKFAKGDFKKLEPSIIERYNYCVRWSEEDQEYVGTCSKYPSLSWLSKNPGEAFNGIVKIVVEVEKDIKNSNPSICDINSGKGKMTRKGD